MARILLIHEAESADRIQLLLEGVGHAVERDNEAAFADLEPGSHDVLVLDCRDPLSGELNLAVVSLDRWLSEANGRFHRDAFIRLPSLATDDALLKAVARASQLPRLESLAPVLRAGAASRIARVPFDEPVLIRFGQRRHVAQGLNLSTKGVAFEAPFSLDAGRHVRIELPVDKTTITVGGRITWSVWNNARGVRTLGMTFGKLPSHTLERIQDIVAAGGTPPSEDLQAARRHVRVALTAVAHLDTGQVPGSVGRCIDLSEGGIGITVPTPLQAGQQVTLDVELPDAQLAEQAQVLWSTRDGTSWRLGLEFLAPSPLNSARIRALVAAATPA